MNEEFHDPEPEGRTGTAGEAKVGSSPRDGRTGRFLAGVLLLALAFGAGLVLGGGSRGTATTGSGTGQGRATQTAGAAPASGSPSAASPAPSAAPGTPTGSTTPSGSAPVASDGSPSAPGATGSAEPTEDPSVSPRPVSSATAPADLPEGFGLFWEAYERIRGSYVDRADLDPRELTDGAIRGMVEAVGDEGHTIFLTPEDRQRQQRGLSGELVGIGVILDSREEDPVIVTVITGGPAARAGLRPGDRIVAVDGTATDDATAEEVISRIRGEEGTPVTVRVIRPETQEPIEVSIVRERIVVPAVEWVMLPDTTVAYVRLAQFSEGATEQLRAALGEAREQGATGIVFDVRNNPGGLLVEAVGVASQFLTEGVVYIRQGADQVRTEVPVESGGVATDLPMVVLINEGSASSAEIVAGALQDAERGQLVGETTFGTGTLVTTFDLSDGSAVQVGVERWLTPSGRRIFGEGVAPDVPVELGDEALPLEPSQVRELDAAGLRASGDTQLVQALELLAP